LNGARLRLVPPVWFLASLVAMLLLERYAPVVAWHAPALRAAGGALIIAGLATSLSGALRFRRHGTPVKPFERSSVLVTDGPYRVTRNPMYLGLVVILLGVGLVLEALSPFAIVIAFIAVITRFFIVPEERMLEERFGDAYAAFRGRVRRWL
jgi:protein-S-isoprenylcysteine O-methyltransferase Ste14